MLLRSTSFVHVRSQTLSRLLLFSKSQPKTIPTPRRPADPLSPKPRGCRAGSANQSPVTPSNAWNPESAAFSCRPLPETSDSSVHSLCHADEWSLDRRRHLYRSPRRAEGFIL